MAREFVFTVDVGPYDWFFTEDDLDEFFRLTGVDLTAPSVKIEPPQEYFVAGVQTDENGLSLEALDDGFSGADAYVFEDGIVGVDAYIAAHGATGDEWLLA